MSDILTAFRKRYPQYDNVEDDDLAFAVGNKYPVYLDKSPEFKKEFQRSVAERGIDTATKTTKAVTDIVTNPAVAEASEMGRNELAAERTKKLTEGTLASERHDVDLGPFSGGVTSPFRKEREAEAGEILMAPGRAIADVAGGVGGVASDLASDFLNRTGIDPSAMPGRNIVQIPKPTIRPDDPAGVRLTKAVVGQAADIASSFTEPGQAAMLPLLAFKPVQALFGLQAAGQIPESAAALLQARTPEQIGAAGTSLAANALIANAVRRGFEPAVEYTKGSELQTPKGATPSAINVESKVQPIERRLLNAPPAGIPPEGTPVPIGKPEVPTPKAEELLPAVKTMDGKLHVASPEETTHADIIKRDGIKAEDIDRRVFVDAKGKEVSREQAATTMPTEIPGQGHSTDLPRAEQTPKERTENAIQPKAETPVRNVQQPEVTKESQGQVPAAEGVKETGEGIQQAVQPLEEKKPWQVTRQQWREGGNRATWNKRDRYHREQVETALAFNKPVPPEVLADYPDLQKPTTPPVAVKKAQVEISRVSATEGARPAKEVKDELLSRVNQEIESLKTKSKASVKSRASEGFPNQYWIESGGERSGIEVEKTKSGYSADVYAPGGKRTVTGKTVEEVIEDAKALMSTGEGKIKIEIPGDGTFTVYRHGPTLVDLRDRIERIKTKPQPTASIPSGDSGKVKANELVDKAKRVYGGDIRKAVTSLESQLSGPYSENIDPKDRPVLEDAIASLRDQLPENVLKNKIRDLTDKLTDSREVLEMMRERKPRLESEIADLTKEINEKLEKKRGVRKLSTAKYAREADLADTNREIESKTAKVKAFEQSLSKAQKDLEALSSTTTESPTSELQLAIVPGLREFIKQDVAPALGKLKDAGKAAAEVIIDTFSPTTHALPKDVDVLFSAKGLKEKVMTRAAAALDKEKAKFDSMPQANQVAFVDRIKRGIQQPTFELQQVADLLRKWDDHLYRMAKRYKPELPYLENHNRVLWKVIPGSPQARGQSVGGVMSKRPWQGSKGFLKRHVLEDMSEGLALGGVPVTFNPVEMFLLHAQDVMKFVSANRAWEGLKKTGSVEFVKTGKRPPPDFVRLDDPIAKVYFQTPQKLLAKGGEWYVEPGAARMIRNYLSRDYIRTGKFGPIGRSLLALKNATTAIELGLSPFHAFFEGLEAVGSSIGIGVQKISTGRIGEGLKDIAKAPVTPFTAARLGGKVIRYAKNPAEFRAKFPDAYDWFTRNYPDTQRLVNDLFSGGGKVSMHEDYRINAIKGFKQAVATNNAIGAAVRTIPALNQLALLPLFEKYIPRVKLGTWLREYSFELERNAADIASGGLTREALAKRTWDFIEDRFGELNWDNLYWDRTFKTAMQLMFRSVTWKLGNLRGFGKAGRDTGAFLRDLVTPGRNAKVTGPMGWLAGMSLTTSVIASVITKGATGKYPWELSGNDEKELLKNLTFPRIDAKDETQRVSIPTYWRDAVHLAHSPVNYVKSSMTGTWGRLWDDWANEDFYGHAIYNPNDRIDQKAYDALKHLIPLPFGASSFIAAQKSGEKGLRSLAGFTGFTKAPGYISPSDRSQVYDMVQKWASNSSDPTLREKARRGAVERERHAEEPSQYQPLRMALHAGNTDLAKEEYDKLLAAGKNQKEVIRAIRPFSVARVPEGWVRHDKPFGGLSQKEERAFENTLTPEQRETFQRAKESRLEDWERLKQILGL